MTATEILQMSSREISSMTNAELKSAARVLFKAANQRAKRTAAKEPEAPAIRGMNETGGKFKLTGKTNINQVRAEVYRAKKFMEGKTSTVKGAKAFRVEMEKVNGGGLTKAQQNKIWKTYNKLKELHPEVLYRGGCYNTEAAKDLQRTISGELNKDKRRSVDYLVEKLNAQLEAEYQAYEAEFSDEEFTELHF